jgi:hypothetical protein
MTTENNASVPSPAPTPAPSPAPTPTEAPAPSSKPWYETRIDGLTKEKYETQAEIEQLKKELAELKAKNVAPTPAATPTPTAAPTKPINMTQEEFDAEVKKRAAQEAELKAFNDKCNNVFESGKKAFADFEDNLKSFSKLGGIPIPVVEIALEFEKPEELIYNLSKNLDKAAEIFKLSPAKQALALERFQREAEKEAKQQNKGPGTPPVKPVVGGTRSSGEKNPEDMSMEEFVAWREKQSA